jgi:2-iminobutanoate/2-iminopropanoate deaminase
MKKLILTLIAVLVASCGSFPVSGQALVKKKPGSTKAQKARPGARQVIKTDRAPQSSSPLSQAIVAGDLVFTAGQLGIDPKTSQMVTGGIEEQTEQVLLNLTAVLEAAGSSPDLVLKTTVFLTSMDDFSAMNAVYRRHFKQDFPARSTVQVARLAANARIEIEAIALVKKN